MTQHTAYRDLVLDPHFLGAMWTILSKISQISRMATARNHITHQTYSAGHRYDHIYYWVNFTWNEFYSTLKSVSQSSKVTIGVTHFHFGSYVLKVDEVFRIIHLHHNSMGSFFFCVTLERLRFFNFIRNFSWDSCTFKRLSSSCTSKIQDVSPTLNVGPRRPHILSYRL